MVIPVAERKVRMEIIDNVLSGTEFKELRVGATFKCDEYYYMKTMGIETEDSRYNSVCLNDGEFEFFAEVDKVIPFNCELTVV